MTGRINLRILRPLTNVKELSLQLKNEIMSSLSTCPLAKHFLILNIKFNFYISTQGYFQLLFKIPALKVSTELFNSRESLSLKVKNFYSSVS